MVHSDWLKGLSVEQHTPVPASALSPVRDDCGHGSVVGTRQRMKRDITLNSVARLFRHRAGGQNLIARTCLCT